VKFEELWQLHCKKIGGIAALNCAMPKHLQKTLKIPSLLHVHNSI
jgi:hypothetical protein